MPLSFFGVFDNSSLSPSWDLHFRSVVRDEELIELQALLGELKMIRLIEGVDDVRVWVGDPSGNQVSAPANVNSVPANHEVSNEEDGDDVEQPSIPSLKRSEEKGICVVHEVKCKLYVKSIDPADKDTWREKGMGQLSIKCKEGVTKGTKESKPTIVIRNDVGKVLLNALLYPGIKTNTQKNSVVAIFHTSTDGDNSDNVVARTFLMRTKTTEDRDKLAAVIQEYAPAA